MKDDFNKQSGRDRNQDSERENTSSKRSREQNTSTREMDRHESTGREMDTDGVSSVLPDNYERDSE